MIKILKDIRNKSGFISTYNKNELAFKSTSSTSNRAIIRSKNQEIELYSDPFGIFHFFIGDFITSFFTKFDDDFEYLPNSNPVVEGTKLVHVFNFDIKIYAGNAIVDSLLLGGLKFLKAVDQHDLKIEDFIDKILAPVQNLTFFKGFPFEYSKLTTSGIKRFYVSNGTNIKTWNGKTVNKCGIYLKWLNQQGAYSYYLFEPNSFIELSAKSQGVVFDNNLDYEQTIEMGKKCNRIQKIHTKIPISEKAIIESLILTPEAYIYTAKRFSSLISWERIRILNTQLKYKDAQNGFVPFTAICELNKPLTQHL